MPAFVKSVEHISTSFDTTTGAVSTTVNLSKGQDETKCVPFNSIRTTTGGTELRENEWVACEMIDNAGTPAVKTHRNANTTASAIQVEIFVVEFGANVTVQQGSVALTGLTASAALTAIVLNNSFCHIQQVNTVDPGSDAWRDTLVQARFSSTTQVDFDRRRADPKDWTIYWYVVESDGIDFLTEYVTFSWASADTTSSRTLSNAVTLANAFVISTYESLDPSDNMLENIINVELTTTTNLEWRRDGGTPAAVGTLGAWVVRTDSNGAAVQRFSVDLAAATTNDQSITAIDQAKAIIVSSNHAGGGAWGVDGTDDGLNVEEHQNTMTFFNDTTVRLQQQNAEAATGGSSRFRFEVIEFELESAAPLPSVSDSPTVTEFNKQNLKLMPVEFN